MTELKAKKRSRAWCQFSSWHIKKNPHIPSNCTEQFLEDFTPLQISHTLCYPTGPQLHKPFLWEILAFDAGACMFVLNIFWNGRLIILRSTLEHWPYFLSNITADRGQTEPHFFRLLHTCRGIWFGNRTAVTSRPCTTRAMNLGCYCICMFRQMSCKSNI